MDDGDTDTLLAVLSSLLDDSASHDHANLLGALADHDGNVQAAAAALSKTSGTTRSTPKPTLSLKRKRVGGLDGWLQSSAPVPDVEEDETPRKLSSSSATRRDRSPSKRAASSSPSKPVVDLMTVLRPPPSIGSSVPRLPPLTLATPDLVAQHTPCTLHPNVLPPELACRLFYTMLDAAQSWSRNKWWLFDRLVESPHRTAFFARATDSEEDTDNWQEAAQFWCISPHVLHHAK
jgi:hypothetical protein